jgi:hypothetical protein
MNVKEFVAKHGFPETPAAERMAADLREMLALHRAAERNRCAHEIEQIGLKIRERKHRRADKWEVSTEFLANMLRRVWPT